MTEFKDWYNSIPYFTRLWLTGTFIISLFARFGLLKAADLIINSELFLKNFQIWRPVTGLFFYPMSFGFLLNCYFIYSYSGMLESGMFAGKPADYLYMLLFQWFCCVVVAMCVDWLPIIMNPMVMSVLYVWCILNKDIVVTFWFGSRFKAMYLPWVLLAFNIIVSNGGLGEFLGILVGHLTFFLIFKYPQEFGGPSLLTTPAFLKQWFPDSRVMGEFGRAPAAAAAAAGGAQREGRHAWGRGHTLGGN